MGKLGNYIAKLSTVTEESLNQEILQIVAEHEEVITAMNTDQLFEGMRSDGAILPDYSRTSVEIYGKPAGPIRLFDEGDFYRGIFLETEQFPVLFGGRDEKTEMLKSEYGKEILGITKENLRELNQSFLKEKIKELYQRILSPL